MLDYDNMILLDAEDLAEGGIGFAYKKHIAPRLQDYVDSPAKVIDDLNTNAPSYAVTSQGQTYVIFTPESDFEGQSSWMQATFALFDIVNRQLQDSPVRLYAINGGNDLGAMFLTKEAYEGAIRSLKNKKDWPYLPTMDPPWCGQPH